MKKIDRMREKVTILPTSVYLSKMHDAGWSLVALEWEREVEVSGLGHFVHQHGRRLERARISHPRWPPLDSRRRIQADSSINRRGSAPALRCRVGIAQETIDPRRLEFLAQRAFHPQSFRAEHADAFSSRLVPARWSAWAERNLSGSFLTSHASSRSSLVCHLRRCPLARSRHSCPIQSQTSGPAPAGPRPALPAGSTFFYRK